MICSEINSFHRAKRKKAFNEFAGEIKNYDF